TTVVLDVDGWRLVAAGQAWPATRGPAAGLRVVAILRPEAVAILAEARGPEGTPGGPSGEPPRANVVEGIVESREYLGAILRYAVRVGPGTVLTADVHK